MLGKNKRFKSGIRVMVYDNDWPPYKMTICKQEANTIKWYAEKRQALVHVELIGGSLIKRRARKVLYKWGAHKFK